MSMFEKYRFQKNPPKLENRREEPPSTPPPSSPDIHAIPETPTSELAEASSPVFGKSTNSGKFVVHNTARANKEEKAPSVAEERSKAKASLQLFEKPSQSASGSSSEKNGQQRKSNPYIPSSGYIGKLIIHSTARANREGKIPSVAPPKKRSKVKKSKARYVHVV